MAPFAPATPWGGPCQALGVFTIITLLASHLKRSQAARLVLIGAACLLAGAGAFSLTQHVSYGTGLYWAITTATTVGYGDVTPKDSAGRVVAVLVMLTTIPLFASAFALFAGAIAATHVRRLLGMVERAPASDEVMVLGWHPSVPRLAAEITAAHQRSVVVVTTADTSGLPPSVRVVRADPTDEQALRRAAPQRAAQLLIAATSDAETLVTAVLIRQAAPKTPAVAIAHSPQIATALSDLGVAVTVSADELLAHTLAKSLEAPHAGELLLRLVDSDGYQLQELPVDDSTVGQTLSHVRQSHPHLVLGAVHDCGVTLGVAQDPTLSAGDRLLVLRPEPAPPATR